MRILARPALIVGALALAGCTNPYDPAQRAAGGALLGAGGGAALGAILGGGRGATTGAIVGGLAGGATGLITTPQPEPQPYFQRPRRY